MSNFQNKMLAYHITKITDLIHDKSPLARVEVPVPSISSDEILLRVNACGICHTELDEIEGRTPPEAYPVIPGHQVIGTIVEKGKNVSSHNIGDRVGVGWINSSCGKCNFCLSGNENLCPEFKATGRDANGGYAEYMSIGEKFAFKIPEYLSDAEAAPLLCAGAVGYRSVKLANITDGMTVALTGFGAAGHISLLTLCHLYPSSKIFVFARSPRERELAIRLGAVWTGDTNDNPPELLNAIIDTTPVWLPVISALNNLKPGGRLVINAIRKENIDIHLLAEIDYAKHLWMEKEIKSVANVSSNDIREFLNIVSQINLKPRVQEYNFDDANIALSDLKNRKILGAKVLVIYPA